MKLQRKFPLRRDGDSRRSKPTKTRVIERAQARKAKATR
jgi:hypothetical protein